MTLPYRFDDDALAAVYRVIELRRDVRDFVPGDVDEGTLGRILRAAALAPSVGFSQPWGFVVVRDRERRERIRTSFLRCREAEAARFPPERRQKYLAYKLEGICDSALNLCVVADLRPRDEAILGTTVQPEAVRASVCCAVQNLWLAARAEGLGVGWVSIVEPAVLREELALPAGVDPIAYLCVGHPRELRARPMLEETGWRPRRAARDAVHEERWRDPSAASSPSPSSSWPSSPSSPSLPWAASDAEPAAPSSARVPPFDAAAARASADRQRLLTKPHGSLGRLEAIAAWYAGAHGAFPPPSPERALLAVFAADHGVVVEGVSAYPSSVTAAMVANMMAGGAAINVMTRRLAIDLAIVDVGVAGDLSIAPVHPVVPLTRAKVRPGTANLRREPAMSEDDARRAMAVGEQTARRAIDDGHQLLAAGEVGIGNTTSAAALVCVLAGAEPGDVVGSGTGISDEVRARKVRVVEDALRVHGVHGGRGAGPIALLARLGGIELASMAGFYLAAARARRPVVVDGFVASAAALVARAFDANVVDYMLLSHASAERGAAIAADALGKRPLLDLGMRLGEGTGAALAIDLVRTAVALERTMATFATAGTVGRAGSF
jgi:nicotinate-nucleotide--dimethylbenzimidazole phosphoribosyltransferase